jgi:hypothetical protein
MIFGYILFSSQTSTTKQSRSKCLPPKCLTLFCGITLKQLNGFNVILALELRNENADDWMCKSGVVNII